jgi:hypothetical protein
MIGLRFLPNVTRKTSAYTAAATSSPSSPPRPSGKSNNGPQTLAWLTHASELVAWPASRNPCDRRNTTVIAANGEDPCWRNVSSWSLLHLDGLAMRGCGGYSVDKPLRLERHGTMLAECYPSVLGVQQCMVLGAYYCSPRGPPPNAATSAATRAAQVLGVGGGLALVAGALVTLIVACR